jgi:pilus assembly protein CpaD
MRRVSRRYSSSRHLVNLAAVMSTALTAGACIHDQGPMVAGWAVTDPAQRHPIMVSKEPTSLALRVPHGANGLSPQQRAQLIGFIDRFGARDAGNSRLFIRAPSGTANEAASMQAVGEIRELLGESGIDETSILVEASHDRTGRQPPIQISYMSYIAEAPECGHWGSNLAEDPVNVGVPNLGCATQANFAAMVANPADLLGPRNETPRASERRDVTWGKYIKGDSTVATKSGDERAKVEIGE